MVERRRKDLERETGGFHVHMVPQLEVDRRRLARVLIIGRKAFRKRNIRGHASLVKTTWKSDIFLVLLMAKRDE